MNFRPRTKDEPEINLIPFIDVLLVVLIFLMLSTTYSKFTELQIKLPLAQAEQMRDRPHEVVVGISIDGRYVINKTLMDGKSIDTLSQGLVAAAGAQRDGTVIIISADANTPHQAVITLMEAARRVGMTQFTFATQAPAPEGGR